MDTGKFVEGMIELLETAQKGRIIVRQFEKRRIYHECAKELEMVNGVMDLVGPDTVLGCAYEIRMEVWYEHREKN